MRRGAWVEPSPVLPPPLRLPPGLLRRPLLRRVLCRTPGGVGLRRALAGGVLLRRGLLGRRLLRGRRSRTPLPRHLPAALRTPGLTRGLPASAGSRPATTPGPVP